MRIKAVAGSTPSCGTQLQVLDRHLTEDLRGQLVAIGADGKQHPEVVEAAALSHREPARCWACRASE
jgi:hypothetical protein